MILLHILDLFQNIVPTEKTSTWATESFIIKQQYLHNI